LDGEFTVSSRVVSGGGEEHKYKLFTELALY
jgi:hypothetical protein